MYIYIYINRVNANRGIFVRPAATMRRARVDLKAYLRENISRYIQYGSTVIRSLSREREGGSGEKAKRVSPEMNERLQTGSSMKIRAFHVSRSRRGDATPRRVAGSAFWLSSCIASIQFP